MKRCLIFGAALLILAFCSVPVHAASPDSSAAAWAAIFAPAPAVDAQPQAQDAAARRGLPTKSTSIAHCNDGSTVTCTGTTTTAVDANCAAGQRGYCTGSSGTIYCPACPTGGGCTATATCSNGSTVSCTSAPGYTGCFGLKNCYADCGGALVWCSPHPSCPV
jgi:hypothetical protein